MGVCHLLCCLTSVTLGASSIGVRNNMSSCFVGVWVDSAVEEPVS